MLIECTTAIAITICAEVMAENSRIQDYMCGYNKKFKLNLATQLPYLRKMGACTVQLI